MTDFFEYFERLGNSLNSFPPFIVETLLILSVIGIAIILIKLFR